MEIVALHHVLHLQSVHCLVPMGDESNYCTAVSSANFTKRLFLQASTAVIHRQCVLQWSEQTALGQPLLRIMIKDWLFLDSNSDNYLSQRSNSLSVPRFTYQHMHDHIPTKQTVLRINMHINKPKIEEVQNSSVK